MQLSVKMERGNCEEKPVSCLDFRNVKEFVVNYNGYNLQKLD